jgi:hypothetical protein
MGVFFGSNKFGRFLTPFIRFLVGVVSNAAVQPILPGALLKAWNALALIGY